MCTPEISQGNRSVLPENLAAVQGGGSESPTMNLRQKTGEETACQARNGGG